jgi:hypothetical protein
MSNEGARGVGAWRCFALCELLKIFDWICFACVRGARMEVVAMAGAGSGTMSATTKWARR